MMRRSAGLLIAGFLGTSTPALSQEPASTGTFADPPSAAPAPAPAAPPPAAPPPASPAPATPPPAPAPLIISPPPPPPRSTDNRPIRARRPFFIAGELGWNGLAGLGVNFSYHPIPRLAIDTGLGLSLAGGRLGVRARANFLTSEWTPFLAVGMTYAGGTGDKTVTVKSKGEDVELEVLPSPYAQFAGGVCYTGSEGFVFMATTGYALLLEPDNTRFVSGSPQAYQDVQALYDGGLILSVAFGYAF